MIALPGVSAFLCLLGFAWAQAPSDVPPQPVITTIAGPLITYHSTKPEVLPGAIRDMSAHGDLLWVNIPTWSKGILDQQHEIDRARESIRLCHENGIDVVLNVPWGCLLPKEDEIPACPWVGEELDPETGEFKRVRSWDLASDEAHGEFGGRAGELFERVGGPVEMYCQDEIIVGEPGENFWYQRISTYWSGPTFSREALESFRKYLAEHEYPDAQQARFPVTTVAVEPGATANEGLPAIALTDANRSRLCEDNDWPESDLWKHWYAWREDLYTKWLGTITTAAAEAWSDNPRWKGCIYTTPATWAVTGLGQNLDKIAALKHMDCISTGYCSGTNFEAFKSAAKRAGKQWGIVVELARYGQGKGMDVAVIEEVFKAGVEAGASVVSMYPGTAFRTDLKEPSESALYYMPEQIKAWDGCREWLKER